MLTANQIALIEKHLNDDPVKVALKTADREVAQQVATLQKAQLKLPLYFNARCHITPIAYQQCTSQTIAFARNLPEGLSAIDLTCGLGVDSLYLASRFKKVTSCEIDPAKALTAKHNFNLLNALNIEVVNASAEKFLTTFQNHADLIFCDPSRRDNQGKKIHALQECKPNIIELMPRMKQIANNIVVKLSPLFDVDELFTILGEEIEVETISQNGECKEVVIHIGQHAKPASLSCTIHTNTTTQRLIFPRHTTTQTNTMPLTQTKYLHIPDVAILKSRTVNQYMALHYPSTNYNFNGYLFTETPLQNFAGRTFNITQINPYKPKILKKQLASQDITRATIYRRNFPYSTDTIIKQLALTEGGSVNLFFTTIDNKPNMIM